MRTYHVYIMASLSKVIYVGITNDLVHRVSQHKERCTPGFTARYFVTELVWYEAYGDVRTAIAKEKQIKGWLRARKIALIEASNPQWRDLTDTLHSVPQPRSARNDSSLRSE